MKIAKIRVVRLANVMPPPKTKARRPTWNTRSPRALPLNYYPEFRA